MDTKPPCLSPPPWSRLGCSNYLNSFQPSKDQHHQSHHRPPSGWNTEHPMMLDSFWPVVNDS